MGSDHYRTPCKSCVLCAKSEETEITGALSSKDNISAHQNCLLYASGIYCKNSPTYDDLFGFDVHDVEKELRRGRKLICHLCHERGATAGCDVRRCKRSYHYPCAKEDSAKFVEDNKAGRYVLFCEKHDPDNKKTRTSDGASTSGLNLSKRHGSSDSHGRMSDRRESNSSTGSSVSSRKLFPQSSDTSPDDEIQTCIDPMFAPLESDMDDSPPLTLHNSATVTEDARPCEEVNPSSLGSVYGASTSGLNHSKGDNPGQHNNRIEYDTPSSSPETPRRKKKKLSVLHSDDETSTDPVVSPAVPHVGDCTPQLQHNHSTPVNENTRSCEGPNPSSTGHDDDGDDTDIESDVSQSLLASEPYNITVQCTVITDSGPSIESENSLEPCSPSRSIPAYVCTTPEAVTAPQPVITNITAPEPKASTTDPVSPGSAEPTPHQERSDDGLPNQPGSPDRSSSTSDCPVLISLQASDVTADDPAEHFPPEKQSTSFCHPATADACSEDAMASSESSAATFWAKCNEAGCTEKIFTELLSQLSSLGDRIQSSDASQQDFDVARKVLQASGRLPVIVTQLEQDLKYQEQELQRKLAALRNARAALGGSRHL